MPRAARMIPRSCASIVLASAIWLLVGAMPNPDAAFATLWESMPDRAGWQMLVSPPLPRDWPLRQDGHVAVVRYAFAMRLRPGLADSAEMTVPWAELIQTSDGAVDVESLSGRLEPLSLQGVRPLRSAEVTLIAREQEVVDQLLADGSPSDDRLLRDFTCSWMGRLSVVAAAIAPSHPAFMRWLACR